MATGYEDLIRMALNPDETDPTRNLASLVSMQQPKVTPPPKGSGIKEKATDQGTEKSNVTETRNLLMSPEEINQAYQSAVNTDAVKAQMAGVNSLSDLAKVEAQAPVQNDYSSLINLADMWSGSKGQLAKGYQAPERPEVQRARVAALMSKGQDDRRDMTKSILDFIQKQKAGTQMSQLLSEIKRSKESSVQDPDLKPRGGRDPSLLSKDVLTSADRAVKPLGDIAGSYGAIENILEAPTVQNMGVLKSLVARVMAQEKGNLAQGDVGRAFPSTLEEKFARAQAFLTSNPGEVIDRDLIKSLKEEVRKAKETTNDLYSSKLSTVKESFRASPGYESLPLDTMLKPYENFTTKTSAPRKYFDPATDKPANVDQQRQRLEYLRSKKGK